MKLRTEDTISINGIVYEVIDGPNQDDFIDYTLVNTENNTYKSIEFQKDKVVLMDATKTNDTGWEYTNHQEINNSDVEYK